MNEFENIKNTVEASMRMPASKIIVGEIREASIVETF